MKDWITKYYHYLVLGGISLFCLILTLGILISAAAGQKIVEKYRCFVAPTKSESVLTDPSTPYISAVRQILDQPVQWQSKGQNLFVSEIILLARGELRPLKDGPLHPPIPNSEALRTGWDEFRKMNFLDRDSDGDGFTNMEEWRNNADIMDPEMHPPFSDKLKMVGRLTRQRTLKFNVVSAGDYFIHHSVRGQSQNVGVLKIGQSFDNGRFKVADFREAEGVPQLQIEDTRRGKAFWMTNKIPYEWPDLGARFRFELDPDGTTIDVEEGKAFSLTSRPKARYRLIEVKKGEANIVQINREKGENMIAIPVAEP